MIQGLRQFAAASFCCSQYVVQILSIWQKNDILCVYIGEKQNKSNGKR